MQRQLEATTQRRRRTQIAQAIEEIDRRMVATETASRPDGVIGAVHTYHDGTKHHFNRFARSLGYLDWASQPNPFRRFAGAPEIPLHPRPDAAGSASAIRNPTG